MHTTLRSMLAFLLLASSPAAHAEEFSDSFGGNALDAESFDVELPTGFEVAVSGGRLVMSKSEGTTSGYAHVVSHFVLRGDFETTVVAERTLATGGSAMGLVTHHLDPAGFTDVYFTGTTNLYSNIIVPPVNTSASTAAPATTLTLRIRRVGEEIFHEYDAGSGFIVLKQASDPALGGPVQVGLLLAEEGGGGSPSQATYDNLMVEADEITDCGNDDVDEGETCDGNPVWKAGESCNAECQLVPCSDTDDSGAVTVLDALFVLRASVGSRTCDACVCDIDASGSITGVDALSVLRRSVGLPVNIACPDCAA